VGASLPDLNPATAAGGAGAGPPGAGSFAGWRSAAVTGVLSVDPERRRMTLGAGALFFFRTDTGFARQQRSVGAARNISGAKIFRIPSGRFWLLCGLALALWHLALASAWIHVGQSWAKRWLRGIRDDEPGAVPGFRWKLQASSVFTSARDRPVSRGALLPPQAGITQS